MPELTVEISKFIYNYEGFNTPLSIIVQISKQKISKDREEMNNIISQLNIFDIY